MYSIKEKESWIKNHIWEYSPVWFNYGKYDCGIYDPEDVWTENGRLYCRINDRPVDITYHRMTAFEAQDSYNTVQFGFEPIEAIYREDKTCTVKE